MASDGDWGYLAEHEDELAEAWDGFERLPESGSNPYLDSFCEAKRIDIPALMRLGTRLSDDTTLAFPHPGGIKFRDMVTGRRWNYLGSEFKHLKIVPAQESDADTVVVAEGETDAARLTMLYPNVDVAVLPAGARRWTDTFAADVGSYRMVLVGLDNDDAGEAGTRKIMESVTQAERFTPPAQDWCELEGEAPAIPDEPTRQVVPMLVAAGELLDLDAPENASWFEHELLPIGGLLVLHGWAKSFKSFMALDMLASLAQGKDWACFEPMEEPCRVAVVQFEIPWKYYQHRVLQLVAHANDDELVRQNFITYSPIRRPALVAGNQKQEDEMLRNLVDGEIQVVLIDPIRRALGGDMNEEKDVRVMLKFFERLQDEGITVIATHHDNKAGARAGGGDPLAMTGSGAWAGDPDTIISVSVPKGLDIRDPYRNLEFTFRNSPFIAPRGMQMQENGQLLYTTQGHGEDAVEEDDAPAI